MAGFLINRDVEASNFRALFYLNYNQWAKQKMSPQKLWPLSIDQAEQAKQLTMEEIYERNKKIISNGKTS